MSLSNKNWSPLNGRLGYIPSTILLNRTILMKLGIKIPAHAMTRVGMGRLERRSLPPSAAMAAKARSKVLVGSGIWGTLYASTMKLTVRVDDTLEGSRN